MRYHTRSLAFALLIFAGAVGVAHATQLLYRSPQDLGEDAAVVVRGTIQSVESYWNAAHTKIFTRTRIAVDQTYKGSAGPTVDVVQLGGTVGTVKVTVQGALEWQVGEEVLVFAEPYDAATYQVTGFSQGRFKVERDTATGVAYVDVAPPEGVSLVGAPAGQAPSPSVVRRRVTLEQFVTQTLGQRTEPANPGVER
jgi:hypothetical protein